MKTNSSFLLFAVVSLLFLNTSSDAQIKDVKEFHSYLDQTEAVFEDISIQMGIANWNVYSGEGEADQDTPKKRFHELFFDAELNENIEYWHNNLEQIQDTMLRRRVEVWKIVMTGAKVDMDKEIFRLENKLEAVIAGSDTVSSYSAEELNSMVLDLMKMRNEKAVELGYDNYAYMVLELTGLDPDWFLPLADKIDRITYEPYKALLEVHKKEFNKDSVGIYDMMPIAGKYYRNKMNASIKSDNKDSVITESLAAIGINYKTLPIRFVVKEIPYGGNGLAIEIPVDFRIVVKPGMPMSVWMHELGHGLEGTLTMVESPILKGYEWCLGNQPACYAEGMAETSARFIRNEKWLKMYGDQNIEEMKKKSETADKYYPFAVRYALASCMLEVELYKKMGDDPEDIRNDVYKKYLLLDKDVEMPLDFSKNIMYVSYPVYTQNYMLADIISWQVHDALKKKFGDDYIFDIDVGDFMKEYLYKDGEYYHWMEKVRRATGRELDIEAYFKQFGLSLN